VLARVKATVVLLPGYAPDLNPVEGLWAHIKRSLANLAARTLSELETLLRRRLKALQYRHSILGGFLTGTGLALGRPDGLSYAEVGICTTSPRTVEVIAGLSRAGPRPPTVHRCSAGVLV
jgi:hypothetical protein